MAENEILDLGGRRWQPTRGALAKPDLSLTAIAECVADNLQSELQLRLSKALRKGQTLLTIFQAAEQHPAAMRAAVSAFQDQQLARIAREATKAVPTKDAASIAQCATTMLIDGVISKALVFADRSGCFPDSSRRQALRDALHHEFDSRRSALAAVMEASLHGQPVRQLRRKAMGQGQTPIAAGALVLSSLTIRGGNGNHVQGAR